MARLSSAKEAPLAGDEDAARASTAVTVDVTMEEQAPTLSPPRAVVDEVVEIASSEEATEARGKEALAEDATSSGGELGKSLAEASTVAGEQLAEAPIAAGEQLAEAPVVAREQLAEAPVTSEGPLSQEAAGSGEPSTTMRLIWRGRHDPEGRPVFVLDDALEGQLWEQATLCQDLSERSLKTLSSVLSTQLPGTLKVTDLP